MNKRKSSLVLLIALVASSGIQAAEYPSVDAGTQSKRDNTRLEILTTEKNKELARLKEAELALNSAEASKNEAEAKKQREAVDQHQVNINALDTEIENIGGGKTTQKTIRSAPVRLSAPATTPKQDVPYWDTYNRSQAKPSDAQQEDAETDYEQQ
ncbi:hypothetical protein EYT18_21590 [Salmonella enterica]|nr:hypothetical protein [Salmonella enterica]